MGRTIGRRRRPQPIQYLNQRIPGRETDDYSILELAHPDRLQVLTPRKAGDRPFYSARGEIPDETSCPAQEASSYLILTLNYPR